VIGVGDVELFRGASGGLTASTDVSSRMMLGITSMADNQLWEYIDPRYGMLADDDAPGNADAK